MRLRLLTLALCIAGTGAAADVPPPEGMNIQCLTAAEHRLYPGVDIPGPNMLYVPDWWVEGGPGLSWRAYLWDDYYSVLRMERVIAADDCSCENRRPMRSEYREEMEALVAHISPVRWDDLSEDEDSEVRQLERELRERRSELRDDYNAICRRAE